MKKTMKLVALAVVASLTVVACNNNKAAEETVDSTAIEQVAEEVATEAEAVADTVVAVAEETAKEAVKTTANTAKKAVKKAAKNEVKEVEKVSSVSTATPNANAQKTDKPKITL